jgi:hypothetical protein
LGSEDSGNFRRNGRRIDTGNAGHLTVGTRS